MNIFGQMIAHRRATQGNSIDKGRIEDMSNDFGAVFLTHVWKTIISSFPEEDVRITYGDYYSMFWKWKMVPGWSCEPFLVDLRPGE
eukprot:1157271-Pelagomonas_calceolata.AAC.16